MRHITAPLLNNPIIPTALTPKIPTYTNGILLENLANNVMYDIDRHDSYNWQIDTRIPYNPNAIVQMHYFKTKNRIYYNNIVVAKLSNTNGIVDGAWGPIDVTKLPTYAPKETWPQVLDIRYEHIPAYGGTKEYTVWRPENCTATPYNTWGFWRPTQCSLFNSVRIAEYHGWFNDILNPNAIFSYGWSNGRFEYGIPNDPVYNGIYIWSSILCKISIIIHLIQGQSAYNKYYSTIIPIGSGHPLSTGGGVTQFNLFLLEKEPVNNPYFTPIKRSAV